MWPTKRERDPGGPATLDGSTAGAVIRRLARPLYIPSALYSVGTGAAIPAQVLVGLAVGLDAGDVALALTLSGVIMVVATAATGPVVERWGEAAALIGSTVAAVLAVTALAAAIVAEVARVPAYLLALAVFNVTDGVWGIARQELMARWIPATVRGRAVNTYGAAQRVGRLAGPFVAGGLILLIGPVAGFVVFAVAAVVGCVTLLSATPPADASAPQVSSSSSSSSSSPSVLPPDGGADHPATTGVAVPGSGSAQRIPRQAWAGFWAVGVSVVALSVLRGNQEVLLPLWASGVVRLPAAEVSFAMGVWMLLELALFFPAGWALDRWGPTPVAATCLLGLTVGFALLLLPGWFWAAVVVLGLAGGTGSGIVKTLGIVLAPAIGRPRFLARWTALAAFGAVVAPGMIALTQRISLEASVIATVLTGCAGAVWLLTVGRRFLSPRVDPVNVKN